MRKPTLYVSRGVWHVRLWDDKLKKYAASRSTGVSADGKWQNRRKAEDAAERIAAEHYAERAAGVSASMPLLSYLDYFWSDASEYVREKASVSKKPLSYQYLLQNRSVIKTKIAPFPEFGNLALDGITKPVLRRWKIWLAEKGYSGRSINSALQCLGVAVKKAYEDDVIKTFPLAGVKRAAHEEKRRGILTPDEIRRLAATPYKDPFSRLAVWLPLYCSMRMGEVRGLQWGDISPDGIIHICHN